MPAYDRVVCVLGRQRELLSEVVAEVFARDRGVFPADEPGMPARIR
ncbi:hypothetical protein [Amycolatopsis sp. CA-128772]|nr:hypothetical protein [Amycolatopsis sp. CA-128772]